jgi:hypothetical protein
MSPHAQPHGHDPYGSGNLAFVPLAAYFYRHMPGLCEPGLWCVVMPTMRGGLEAFHNCVVDDFGSLVPVGARA